MTYGECTLEDVARELGVTRERARQIQNIALTKLRKNCEAMGYTADDLISEISRNDSQFLQRY
jgi:DNA-directed RNA polymerase sigma subunit (sigma70/sigma32)